MAHAPIVALVVIKSELGGRSVAEEFASPASVMVEPVSEITRPLRPVTSVGVAQRTSPSQ